MNKGRRILLVPVWIILIGMLACSNNNNNASENNHSAPKDSITIDEKKTSITLLESESIDLFNIQYQFANNSNETIGPIYVNIHFYNNQLTDWLQMKEYAPYKRIGANEDLITLNQGETRLGGVSLKVVNGPINSNELKEIITNTDAVEIQLIDKKENKVLMKQMIHKFQTVK